MLTCLHGAETHPDLSFQVTSGLALLACAAKCCDAAASWVAMQEIKKRVHKSWMGMSAEDKAAYEVHTALPAPSTACQQADELSSPCYADTPGSGGVCNSCSSSQEAGCEGSLQAQGCN